MHEGLHSIGIREIVPGEANFLMFHLEESQPTAPQIINVARKEGVFVRDVASMGGKLASHALRIAIKDPAGTKRVLQTLQRALLQHERAAKVTQAVAAAT
jgi:histidinol-phosphate/aromatic aminotransferase/cobyric acid decarboxylase-like protein